MWIGYVCGAAAAGNFYMSCPTSLPSAMTTVALEEALEECAYCALPPRCDRARLLARRVRFSAPGGIRPRRRAALQPRYPAARVGTRICSRTATAAHRGRCCRRRCCKSARSRGCRC